MSFRKRLKYAWNAFTADPELLEDSFEGAYELGQPVPKDVEDSIRLERQYERLMKVNVYLEQVEDDLGIEVEK